MKFTHGVSMAVKVLMVIVLMAIYERLYRISAEGYIKPLPRTTSDRDRQQRESAARSQRGDR